MNFYFRIEKFIIYASKKYDRQGKKLQDVGAGENPYRKYFQKVSYFTQDVLQNPKKNIDYLCDISKTCNKIKSTSFDYILCTQVLEHLQDPKKAFDV